MKIAVTAVLLASLSFLLTAVGSTAPKPSRESLNDSYHGVVEEIATGPIDESRGIKEEVPAKYAARYQEWKREFLATETGRNQWSAYEHNPNFTLTIAVSRENAEGATTGRYKWNDSGQLIAATITLGIRLDEGYPNPVYFPVMNSLVPTESFNRVNGITLAATKIAHEFGHVNRTGKADAAVYQLQSQLIPQYNKIFLSNGRNANDAGTGGYLDRIKVERVQEFLDFLLARLHAEKAELMGKIGDGDWDDSIESELGEEIAEAIDDFGPDFDEEGNALEEGESDRIMSEDERAKPGRTASDEDETEEQEDAEREKEPASA